MSSISKAINFLFNPLVPMSKNNLNFLMPFQDVASDALKRSNQLVPFESDE